MSSNESINEFDVRMLTYDHKILICNNDNNVDKNYTGLVLKCINAINFNLFIHSLLSFPRQQFLKYDMKSFFFCGFFLIDK